MYCANFWLARRICVLTGLHGESGAEPTAVTPQVATRHTPRRRVFLAPPRALARGEIRISLRLAGFSRTPSGTFLRDVNLASKWQSRNSLFCWGSCKNNSRTRHKKPPGFCLQNAKKKNALNGAQSPDKNRADARKPIRLLGVVQKKRKRRNPSSAKWLAKNCQWPIGCTFALKHSRWLVLLRKQAQAVRKRTHKPPQTPPEPTKGPGGGCGALG